MALASDGKGDSRTVKNIPMTAIEQNQQYNRLRRQVRRRRGDDHVRPKGRRTSLLLREGFVQIVCPFG
jgi:U3 small nucleolar ribonucleoprotein component